LHQSVSGAGARARGVRRKYTERELEFGYHRFGSVWANGHGAFIQPWPNFLSSSEPASYGCMGSRSAGESRLREARSVNSASSRKSLVLDSWTHGTCGFSTIVQKTRARRRCRAVALARYAGNRRFAYPPLDTVPFTRAGHWRGSRQSDPSRGSRSRSVPCDAAGSLARAPRRSLSPTHAPRGCVPPGRAIVAPVSRRHVCLTPRRRMRKLQRRYGLIVGPRGCRR